MEDKISVAVIGAGAAGLAAAIFAARQGATVTIFEKNKYPAKKLRITGKGRCNVCNNCTPEEVLQNVTKNSKFLYSSVFTFPPKEVMSFFEELGVPLKTERGRRVFPVSDKASDISDALIDECGRLNVRIIHEAVKEIKEENGEIRSLFTESGEFLCDSIILATGGVSYPLTGSTGDGHRMAEKLGISVTGLSPSLVPVVCRENTAQMMGLSLKNVTLSVYHGTKQIYSEMGEMLFTHFGVSGPLVLSASSHMQDYPITEYKMFIDLKPALDAQTLDKRLISDFTKFSTKDFANALVNLLPKSMISYTVGISGISEHIKCSEITKEMRKNFGALLKAFPLTPTAFRPISEAIITRGGIEIKEIAPSTMMSKKVSGLFFAGEIIDTDAYTGGYNLQIAWSTAKKAGCAAAEYVFSKGNCHEA